ncbi:MAG: PIN domain-containing protein [Chloracidobacterium sp.]|nr:PIN domain-containing protein [Chloracidobacterium sp.]
MILVDTSIWIDHLRSANRPLASLLERELVLTHPLVIEELACGSIRHRNEFIRRLNSLPTATIAAHAEILGLIEEKSLHGIGIGAVDTHLLASALLDGAKVWSRDKALIKAATRLNLSFD